MLSLWAQQKLCSCDGFYSCRLLSRCDSSTFLFSLLFLRSSFLVESKCVECLLRVMDVIKTCKDTDLLGWNDNVRSADLSGSQLGVPRLHVLLS